MDREPSGSERAGAVVSAHRIRLGDGPVRIGGPRAPGESTPHEPTISLVTEDGVVLAIDITCGCGEQIRIRCDYT